MNDEWYNVQPRFVSDTIKNQENQENYENIEIHEPQPVKKSFFQRYKTYIIIVVVIIVLIIIFLYIYYGKKSKNERFLIE